MQVHMPHGICHFSAKVFETHENLSNLFSDFSMQSLHHLSNKINAWKMAEPLSVWVSKQTPNLNEK